MEQQDYYKAGAIIAAQAFQEDKLESWDVFKSKIGFAQLVKKHKLTPEQVGRFKMGFENQKELLERGN